MAISSASFPSHPAPDTRRSAAAVEHWRQRLTWALGVAWLVDAALQYQPYMFTTDFPHDVIAPTAAGNPGLVRGPVTWSATLMAHHIVVLNALFATVQLAIALGLFLRPAVKLALAATVGWSLLVWWLGTGLGGMLAGPVSPLAGLPGAVILYALIAVLLWPRRRPAGTVADASPLGAAGSRLVWVVLWAAFTFETLRPTNRAAAAVHDLITGTAAGEPQWIKNINGWAAGLVDGRGTGVSLGLAICFAIIALSVLTPHLTRPGLILAVVLSLAIWVLTEDFGTIATGHATDLNSGPLLALLTLCFWPTTITSSAATPTEHHATDRGHPTKQDPQGARGLDT